MYTLYFYIIHFTVAANQNTNQLIVSLEEQCFNGFISRYIQERRYVFDGFGVWCEYFFQSQLCLFTGFWCRSRTWCDFQVCCITAVIAVNNCVFTDFSQCGKFMCLAVANGTAVCFDWTEFQTAAARSLTTTVNSCVVPR